MKSQHRIVSQIILVLLFGMIMITASAQDKHSGQGSNKNQREQNPPPPAPPSTDTYPAPPPPPPPPNEALDEAPVPLDLPDLTPDQQDKIKKADLKHISEMTPLRNQLREHRARLSTILTTVPVDLKQADQVADEIGKTVSSILKAQIRHDQDLRNILTPDQQIIFDSRPKPWLNKRHQTFPN